MSPSPDSPRLFSPNQGSNNGHPEYDAEVKLLESIAKRLWPTASRGATTDDFSGKVYLFSENKPCSSCSDVGMEGIVQQFEKMFKGVKVVVEYSYYYPGNR
ncbi:deaminase domain-containing protein [Rubinisphaera margarita]|uniref:deaminase domain-containing protein n=1 Tax=Rubinisphaera margarita TaxID=2909586 RepID=UPI0036F311DA